ncbi:cysteine hydrolase family protein [Pseudomonas massiliensis]|uniref:cysteine hydrolase family protein n=1 Tax=Pseudomonas massiliensis TaxID=522492 RepID=UPI0005910E4E|nr:cysteine hydrolase family protein [Pseudomonas massiliensis]
MVAIAQAPALVIIDMQRGMQASHLGPRNNPSAERNIAALLAHWRTQGYPVVHIRHISRSPDSVFRPGQPGCEFQPALAPLAEEAVFEKNVPDAFIATQLERWLRLRSIDALVMVGVATNNSVEATARTGGNLGFKVRVVSDATFTFDQQDLGGRLWPAEDIQALSLSNLAMDYATVVTTADCLTSA